MAFENRFNIIQRLPTTYRLIATGDSLRKPQVAVQTTAPTPAVAPPRLSQPAKEKSGRGEQVSRPSVNVGRVAADLGEITARDIRSGFTSPTTLGLAAVSTVAAGISAISQARDIATTRREAERLSRREAFQDSIVPDPVNTPQRVVERATRNNNGTSTGFGRETGFGESGRGGAGGGGSRGGSNSNQPDSPGGARGQGL